ncbi:MAG: glycosyltransferase family 2 protein, partial [Bacteroidia bacterium]
EVQVEMKERQGGSSSISGFSSVYYMMKVSLAICFTYFKK